MAKKKFVHKDDEIIVLKVFNALVETEDQSCFINALSTLKLSTAAKRDRRGLDRKGSGIQSSAIAEAIDIPLK